MYKLAMIALTLIFSSVFAFATSSSADCSTLENPYAGEYNKCKVLKVQTELNKRGYNIDEDGVLGTETSNAIHSFQQKNDLEANHSITPELMAALGLTRTTSQNKWRAKLRRPSLDRLSAFNIVVKTSPRNYDRAMASMMKSYDKSAIQAGFGIPVSSLEPHEAYDVTIR